MATVTGNLQAVCRSLSRESAFCGGRRAFARRSLLRLTVVPGLSHDLIFISHVKIFSSGRALQTTLRATP